VAPESVAVVAGPVGTGTVTSAGVGECSEPPSATGGEGQQVVVGRLDEDRVEVDSNSHPISASLQPLAAPGSLDQDAPHRLGRRGEEVAPAVERLRRVGPDEPQVRLVDERRGLERLPRRLARQPCRGEPAELLVDQRQERPGGPGVALLDGREDARHVAHRSRSPIRDRLSVPPRRGIGKISTFDNL
jgi:hypothetical protein